MLVLLLCVVLLNVQFVFTSILSQTIMDIPIYTSTWPVKCINHFQTMGIYPNNITLNIGDTYIAYIGLQTNSQRYGIFTINIPNAQITILQTRAGSYMGWGASAVFEFQASTPIQLSSNKAIITIKSWCYN